MPRRWFHNCIVKPTSSWPCSRKMAAAADESTPPDMATAIFMFRVVLANALEYRRKTRQSGGGGGDENFIDNCDRFCVGRRLCSCRVGSGKAIRVHDF